jgi:hypothetical protein
MTFSEIIFLELPYLEDKFGSDQDKIYQGDGPDRQPGKSQPPVLKVVGEQLPPGKQKGEQPHQRQVEHYETRAFT